VLERRKEKFEYLTGTKKVKLISDVEWRIGNTHAFGARGPGSDPTPKPRTAFLETLFFQTTDLYMYGIT
jgi:hypothetical protein